jgi:hypothetical protein
MRITFSVFVVCAKPNEAATRKMIRVNFVFIRKGVKKIRGLFRAPEID